jgi:hypothetical protein
MELPMKRAVSIVIVLGLIGAAGALAAGAMSDDEPVPSRCPEGTTEWSSINEIAGPGASTREGAVRAELHDIGREASDEAIAAAVIAGGSGGNVGTEGVVVETSEGGVVTMTLTPLDPGWAVEVSSWCAPNAE